MRDSTRKPLPPSLHHQLVRVIIVKPEIEIVAEVQVDDRSQNQGVSSPLYVSSRQNESHQEDLPSPQLVSAQEDVQNLVSRQEDVQSLHDASNLLKGVNACNQEAESQPAINPATRKW